MFLGTELTEILDAIESDTAYDAKEKELLKIGVHVLPKFPKDTTDRNRTSPFAFTGNKFEFRMLGSAASISDANVVLNTAVAESLRQYADVLERAEDFETALHDLIRNTIQAHKRIIFNGNGYDASWLEEAEKRGLLNLKTTPDCVPYLLKEKNVRLFTTHKIYSETELHARYEIMLENYSKVLRIEALTMLEMVNTDILPAVSDYTAKLVRTAEDKKALLGSAAGGYEQKTAARLSSLTEIASEDAAKLDDALLQAGDLPTAQEAASFYQAEVFKDMTELRLAVDEMETRLLAVSVLRRSAVQRPLNVPFVRSAHVSKCSFRDSSFHLCWQRPAGRPAGRCRIWQKSCGFFAKGFAPPAGANSTRFFGGWA